MWTVPLKLVQHHILIIVQPQKVITSGPFSNTYATLYFRFYTVWQKSCLGKVGMGNVGMGHVGMGNVGMGKVGM